MTTYSWYQTLIKPSWAPPASLFGPVWTILYAIIAVSFGTVFYRTLIKRDLPKMIALPFALNLLFNFAFTPLQFGLHSSIYSLQGNNLLAALDILLVLGTLIWALVAIYFTPQTGGAPLKWVAYANIPYLVWVTFATMLQLTITYLNWR